MKKQANDLATHLPLRFAYELVNSNRYKIKVNPAHERGDLEQVGFEHLKMVAIEKDRPDQLLSCGVL